MGKYNIFSDYEKQQKLKIVEQECARVSKSKYWVLKQLGLPKSTYYDWLKTGGKTKSKRPHKIWNKTPKNIEDLIIELRNETSVYRSARSPVGISNRLEESGVFMTSVGVWKVLKRNGKNKEFVTKKNTYRIFPRTDIFLKVACLDDIALTNKNPRDLAVFNAIDEYSQESLGIIFCDHKVNRYDVIALLKQIRHNYKRYPEIVRFDRAQAHLSNAVANFCHQNNIKIQLIDKGIPQQNWPVESFNGVIEQDLINSTRWKWNTLEDKQQLLDEYRIYYNTKKVLNSDPLKRTPREISSGCTSPQTQRRLKFKLLRKRYGQVFARRTMLNSSIFATPNLSEMCVN